MVFSTDHPTRYRSWIGYLWLICVVVGLAGIASVSAFEYRGGIWIFFGAFLFLQVGWFVLIALDVRELGDTLQGGVFNWLYPFSVLLGVPGVLLYLWDRERNLPSKPRRDSDTATPA